MGLVARGDVAQVEARICALSLVEFMAVMRSVQKREDALVAYGEKWKDVEYWGPGVEFPDVKAKAA